MKLLILKSFCLLSWGIIVFSLSVGTAFAEPPKKLDSERLQSVRNALLEKQKQDLIQKTKKAQEEFEKYTKLLEKAQKDDPSQGNWANLEIPEIESLPPDIKYEYLKKLAFDYSKLLNDLKNVPLSEGIDYRNPPVSRTKELIEADLLKIVGEVWRAAPNDMDSKKADQKKASIKTNENRLIKYGFLFLVFNVVAWASFMVPNPNVDFTNRLFAASSAFLVSSIVSYFSALMYFMKKFSKQRYHINSLNREFKKHATLTAPFYDELKKLGYNDIPENYSEREEWLKNSISHAAENAFKKNPELHAELIADTTLSLQEGQKRIQTKHCENGLSQNKEPILSEFTDDLLALKEAEAEAELANSVLKKHKSK